MAGLQDTDIRLTGDWQLTQGKTGDAPTCSDEDCFLQDVQLEAITQEGELFYDKVWGWGLLEFLHSEDDDFTRLEIKERIKSKLGRREEIDLESIEVDFDFREEALLVYVKFQREGSSKKYSVNVELSRVAVEVIPID